jgi:hypothetical protein
MHIGGPKSEGTHIFGPLPVGDYNLSVRDGRKNWIDLAPLAGTNTFGRSGFAIHGRGMIGSHGCIVVNDFSQLMRIYDRVVQRQMAKANPYRLRVIAMGQDLARRFHTV